MKVKESGLWTKTIFESCLLFRLVVFLSAATPASGKWIPLKGNTLLYSSFGEGRRVMHPPGEGGKFMLVNLAAQACVSPSGLLEKLLVETKVSRCYFKTCQLRDFLDSGPLVSLFQSKGAVEAERLETSKW